MNYRLIKISFNVCYSQLILSLIINFIYIQTSKAVIPSRVAIPSKVAIPRLVDILKVATLLQVAIRLQVVTHRAAIHPLRRNRVSKLMELILER